MNTLTTRDLGQASVSAARYRDDWNVFGGGGDEPVSAYGIGDLGEEESGLEGFLGDLGIMDLLKKDVMGVPVWAIGAGALALLVVIPALKKRKRR